MKSIKLRLVIHYLPMIMFTIIASIIFKLFTSVTDTIVFTTDVSGYISVFFLSITLLIGPFNLIFRRKNPLSTDIRRDIGIYGGILAVIHSVVGLFAHLRGRPWLYFVKETETGFVINLDNFGIANYTGLLATLFIILLVAISNNVSITALKASKWKTLQRTSYLMFILVIVHSIYYREVLPEKEILTSIYMFIIALIIVIQLVGMRLKLAKG
ncbi:MAG: hypothetical protein CMJ19_07240 [Phycisphaeraceae bacterium]|nr:hypothetical protein [Phycisphaeraceae bacterium]